MSQSSYTDDKINIFAEFGDSFKLVAETACICHVADGLALRSD